MNKWLPVLSPTSPFKTSFLIAIALARRMGESGALMAYPLYSAFYRDRVMLCPHPLFLSKILLAFHINQGIYLLIFYPKLHTSREEASLHILNVRRALAFCLHKTKTFRASPRLFVSFAEKMNGQPVSTQIFKMGFRLYLDMLQNGWDTSPTQSHSPLL